MGLVVLGVVAAALAGWRWWAGRRGGTLYLVGICSMVAVIGLQGSAGWPPWTLIPLVLVALAGVPGAPEYLRRRTR